MSILDQLIHLMLARVEVKPVPKAELDAFLIQNSPFLGQKRGFGVAECGRFLALCGLDEVGDMQRV